MGTGRRREEDGTARPGGDTAGAVADPPSGAAPRRDADAVVFRWDLDKTYLRTEFDSLRDLVRIPFESAADKVHLPGVPELIAALRRSALARGERPFVYFLSASPPQIGAAIREKLEIDGVDYDGITFKDHWRNIVRGRFRSVREQVGYKLGELLESRMRGPRARREVLFGDDWESDPLIYSLYADILAGALGGPRLEMLLERVGVDREARRRIAQSSRVLGDDPDPEAVARICINLERRSAPGRFRGFGPRLVPCFNYFQAAAALYAAGILDAGGLHDVAHALAARGWTPERLRNSLDDLARRGHVDEEEHERAILVLARAGLDLTLAREHKLRPRLRAALARLRRRLSEMRADEATGPGGALPIDWDAVVEDWIAQQ